MNSKYEECIDACIACAIACEECCSQCIDEGHPDCIRVTGDCAQVCWNFSSLMSRGSEIVPYFAKACEEIAESCMEQCNQYQDSDHHQDCVHACQKCVEECKKKSLSKCLDLTARCHHKIKCDLPLKGHFLRRDYEVRTSTAPLS